LLAGVLAGVARPAHADLPDGFREPPASAPMPAAVKPGSRSLGALRMLKRPPRRAATVEEVRLGEVPVVETTPLAATAPREPAGEVAPELLRRNGGVVVLGHGFGSFQVGWLGPVPIAEPGDARPSAAGAAPAGQIALWTWHFRGGDPWVRAHWLAMVDDERGAEVIWGHGWYGWRSGQTRLERRIRTRVRTFAGGMGHAFRARCPSCPVADRDVLHLVLPGFEFSRAPIAIESIRLTARDGRAVIRRFTRNELARLRPLAPHVPADKDVAIGVEVTRAIGEAEATILVHVREAPPERF
jgi:hypothetical protein